MKTTTRELRLYEPRWHGFARWELVRREFNGDATVSFDLHLERGWIKRPKGSPYLVFDEPLTIKETA